jgi:hypothetical protein
MWYSVLYLIVMLCSYRRPVCILGSAYQLETVKSCLQLCTNLQAVPGAMDCIDGQNWSLIEIVFVKLVVRAGLIS